MVNGEYRYFNGGDLVFADASQIRVDKCVENFVLVSRDTLSLFLPMLKEEALNLHAAGGRLADLAPTVLELMGLSQPDEMTGTSLIV